MTVKFFDKDSKSYFKYKDAQLLLSADHKKRVVIKNKIPRFVNTASYASAFGEQWTSFKKLQLDSFTNTDFTKRRLERCLGGQIETLLRDKIVLEAGCGAGRFTEVMAPHCKELYTFDLSEAIDANFENNQSDHITFFQGDILNIPFEDDIFDIVICLGVIQHTPDTKSAIEELWRVVKPGGHLIADHYRFRWAYYTTVIPFYRFFLKKMDPKKSMKIVNRLINIFYPLHWKFRDSKLIKWLLGHLSPVLTNIEAFESKGYKFNRDMSLLETYDALTDYYKRLITRKELETMIVNLPNVSEYKLKKDGNGWEFIVTKSAYG